MFQLIITILIILAALGFAIYKTVKNLRNPLRKCQGCDMTCGGCSLEELKKQLEH